MRYILKDKQPVLEPDVTTWDNWFTHNNRVVAATKISEDAIVSTVFIGLYDTMFETCVFYKDFCDIITRYNTWEEAVSGHEETVRKLLA